MVRYRCLTTGVRRITVVRPFVNRSPVPYRRAGHRKSPPTIPATTMARHDEKTCVRPITAVFCDSMLAEQFVLTGTRNSSGDEIANVNFLYDDIVHLLQNTIDSCINSATDRRGYVLERMFAKFSEITQCSGHYAIQGHSRSPILVPIESSYTTSY